MRGWGPLIIIGALLVLYSCATSNALKTTAISERNIDNLARLNLGMTKSQVLGIMRDPFECEVVKLKEEKYDVLFYITNPTVLGQTRMVRFNLTPLIFKDKILIGTGYGYYNWLKNKILEAQKPAAPVEQPPPPNESSPPPKKEIKIDEEDEEMIQDEGDQNFNFW